MELGEPPLRPPGAVDERAFRQLCTGCGDCVVACPQAIITAGRGGAPVLDLSRARCDFCNACTDACTTGALVAGADWPWRARIGSGCLSLRGVSCRICEDGCDAAAIRFRPALGGCATPRIDPLSCTGCGECISLCPEAAITLTRQPRPERTTPC